MHEKQSLDRDARLKRLVVISAGFVASLGLGIILLASGDWIPGGIIAAAGLTGLAAQIPGLWRLYRERSGRPRPRSRAAH